MVFIKLILGGMEKMKIYILGDTQENFPTFSNNGHINDHQDEETFKSILEAVTDLGYECEIYGGVPELINAYAHKDRYPDSLFLNFSDGMTQRYSRTQIPVLCDLLNINYCGSGTFEAALATNKYYSKVAVQKLGIPCPEGVLVSSSTIWNKKLFSHMKYPLFLKPNSEGSSIGISENGICNSHDEVYHKVHTMLETFEEVLVEEFVYGYDITDFVIGNAESILLNEPLVAYHNCKPVYGDSVMTIEDYLIRSNTYRPMKDVFNHEVAEKIKNLSLMITKHFNLHDYSRIDYRMTKDFNIYFLEANTSPAVHKKSQAGAICKYNNITFSSFIGLLIDAARTRIGI